MNQIETSAGYGNSNTNEYNDYHYLRSAFHMTGRNEKTVLATSIGRGYLKFTDSSIGGNYAINTPYQFTRLADVHSPQAAPVGFGMGEFYSDVIDDNRHDIHLRFGLPMYNSFAGFFLTWHNYSVAKVARTGRAPGIFYSLGNLIGIGVGFVYPSVVVAGTLMSLVAGSDMNNYYTMKPLMGLYWSTVNTLVNSVATQMGLTPNVNDQAKADINKALRGSGKNIKFIEGDQDVFNKLTTIMPSVWKKPKFTNDDDFAIDVASVATRAQRYYNYFNKVLSSTLKANSGGGNPDKMYKVIESQAEIIFKSLNDNKHSLNKMGLTAYLQEYFKTPQGSGLDDNAGRSKSHDDVESKSGKGNYESMIDVETTEGYYGNSTGRRTETPTSSLSDLMKAELDEGRAWLTLRVDGKDSVSESFSNSVEESELAGTLNGVAKARNKISFNTMGGNIAGEFIKDILGSVEDIIAGTASQLNLDGLMGFLSGSMVEIPKVYGSSTANLPKVDYTIKLRTPYGHPVAILQDLCLPTLALLTPALPLSHGSQAFGAPFMVEVYDKGRCTIRRGYIENISITRGVGNVPWVPDSGLPLGIDITFSIVNCDNILHVPIATHSTIFDKAMPQKILRKVLIGQDGALDDYLTILGAVGVNDQIFRTGRWRRKWSEVMKDVQQSFSMSNFVQSLGDTEPMKLLQLFSHPLAR